jgi:hypothetical protein
MRDDEKGTNHPLETRHDGGPRSVSKDRAPPKDWLASLEISSHFVISSHSQFSAKVVILPKRLCY